MKIGITIGDVNGIGSEIIIKVLSNELLLSKFTPIIYGSSKVLSYHKNTLKDIDASFYNITSADSAQKGKINVINCWEENVNITLGQATEDGGKFAYIALDKATRDLKDGQIDALVTAPINKEAMAIAKFPYPGHTEFLEKELGGKSLMMMVSSDLKVAVVTNHIPVKDIATKLTKQLILEKLDTFNQSLIKDFDKERPVIAVLGLNPHASDNGTIGEEDEKIVKPAIIEAKKKGMIVSGPYSADGFFGSGLYKKVDGVLAMYHDQGLIPFKTISFGDGVNYTAGLDFVRTSPDHGTGYDIVGQDKADTNSFVAALFLAINIRKNRAQYSFDRKNSIVKSQRSSYNEDDDEILDEN